MMRRLLSLFALLLCAAAAQATTHAITSTGGGTNSGADWNNPCNGFTGNCAGSAMVRGDTYYVAGGASGAYTNAANAPVLKVTTATSGTTPITIKAATIADHGPATGWVNTLAVDGGAGQAAFATAGNATLEASTSYVVFDGNFSASDTSSTWANPGFACGGTQCGFLSDQHIISAASSASKNTYGVYIDPGVTNVTVRSMEFVGAWSTAGNLGIGTDFIRTPSGGSGMIFQHNYLHDSSQAYFQIYGSTGTIIRWNYMYKNYSHVTAPAIHGSCLEMSGNTNLTFAFNAIRDSQGTACVSELSSGITSSSGVLVYGNIAWMTQGNPNGLTGGYDNGFVSCTNGQVCTGWKVFNNTLVNETLSTNNSMNGGSPVGAASSILVLNNLFYNSHSANNQCVNWTGSCTYDYNSYSGTTQNTPGAHDQTIAGNPFVNWPLNTTAGFQLITDTSAWLSQSSPFNVDMTGLTRTSSRGALQITSSSVPIISMAPSPAVFPTTPQGNTSAPLTITVTNTGTAAETISSITITTGNASDFTNTGTGSCSSSLAAGANCSINVTCSPSGSGTRTSVVTVNGTVNSTDTLSCVAGAPIPAAPTGLTATASGTQINLAWSPSTGTPTGYLVSRSAVSGGPYTQIANVINGATSYADLNLANGTYYYVVAAYNSSGTSANSTQASATVATNCSLQFSPPTAAFPPSPVGVAATNQIVGVTNVGTASCTSIVVNNPSGTNAADFGQTNTSSGTLAVGANFSITVTFTPSLASTEIAAIVVSSNDPFSPDTINLSGIGTAPSGVTPSSLTFGNTYVNKNSGSQTATFTNQSGSTVSFSSIAVSTGNSTQFTKGTDACGGSVATGATCTVAVTFTPTGTGNACTVTGISTSALVFTFTGASGSPISLPLTGQCRSHRIGKVL